MGVLYFMTQGNKYPHETGNEQRYIGAPLHRSAAEQLLHDVVLARRNRLPANLIHADLFREGGDGSPERLEVGTGVRVPFFAVGQRQKPDDAPVYFGSVHAR